MMQLDLTRSAARDSRRVNTRSAPRTAAENAAAVANSEGQEECMLSPRERMPLNTSNEGVSNVFDDMVGSVSKVFAAPYP